MNALRHNLRQLRRYPSAIVGMIIILGLVTISIYAIVTIPYNEAIRLWRGGDDVWADSPRNAAPIWYNWFTKTHLPVTVVIDSTDPTITKTVEQTSEDITEMNMTFSLDFPYDTFPPEMILYFTADYVEKEPFISLTWITPDGREIRVGDITPGHSDSYRFAQDSRLQRRLGGLVAEQGLFVDPASDPDNPVPLKGTYQLNIEGLVFEDNSSFEAKLVMFGLLHGWGGTDHQRRDLMVALLWGTPLALAFGLLAAVGSTLTTMAIAAVGVWFGGPLDAAIQRITEVNLILPLLPILIMIGTFYSRSLWVILGAVILLSIFGAAIKTYRAVFLQIRELPYIDAARAYGAGSSRIIFSYLVPRVLPLLIPNLVTLVPTFVFLEATLAVLGLGDPILPTWGKIIQNANAQGALFNGYYYWILEPAVLLMLAGLAFAMVGFALDRIFNPRLREL
jgi:peptide/nickel transport system permease protein